MPAEKIPRAVTAPPPPAHLPDYPMPFTRDQVRQSVERAGDEHWQALIRHHEDAYPASRPTPGDVCRAEAERLNGLGLTDDVTLAETRVERVGDAVRITHVLESGPSKDRRLTEPYTNYE
jgi:hypothetical protein